jgi:hypothetical protein
VGAELTRQLVVLLAALASAGTVHSQSPGKQRYSELARTVDRNVGHAHLTRGVNVCTIAALRRQVTDADIPVLQEMLSSKDNVHRLAAGYVLSILGARGTDALRQGGTKLAPGDAADFIARAAETQKAVELAPSDPSCKR